jgi:hypothetical protein
MKCQDKDLTPQHKVIAAQHYSRAYAVSSDKIQPYFSSVPLMIADRLFPAWIFMYTRSRHLWFDQNPYRAKMPAGMLSRAQRLLVMQVGAGEGPWHEWTIYLRLSREFSKEGVGNV